MKLKSELKTKQYCIYCKNELISEEEIKLEAHQECINEIALFKEEHDITKSFNEPDAKFLFEVYTILGIPYEKVEFSGKRPGTFIGRVLHSHQKPTIEIEVVNRQLISLHISGTRISGIPESIKDVKTLKRLWLSNNRIVEFPKSICQLPQLEELFLDGNFLTTVPTEIGNLTSLKKLDLSGNNDSFLCLEVDLRSLFKRGNKIIELPDSIGKLIHLEALNLHRNALTKLPENIGKLTNLSELTLEANNLNQLPESITNLIKLKKLNLDHNKLEDLPETIGAMINLEELHADNNVLKKLPDSIGNLLNLKRLSIGYYGTWYFPRERGKVELGQIPHNKVHSLPKSIAQLKSLNHLDLTFNEFEEYPEVLSTLPLTNCGSLNISWNKLPEIPDNLKKFFLKKDGTLDEFSFYGNSIRRR